MRPGALLYTDVAEMNVLLVGRAECLITFIDEESGHSTCNRKTEVDAAEFLKWHARWV